MIIIILITTFLALSSFITASNVYNENEKGFKRITKTGSLIISLNLIIIILTGIQYFGNKRELRKSEAAAVIRQNDRDSILRVRYDSSLIIMKGKYDTSNIRTIAVVTELLANYGFRLDSSNRRLLKIIRDSSKTKIILPNDPVLQLCPRIGIEYRDTRENHNFYNVQICSKDASSSNFYINCPYIIGDSVGNLTYIGKLDLPTDLKISKDNSITAFLAIPSSFTYKYIYLLFDGTYSNADNTKIFPINDLYYYNENGKTSGLIKGKLKTQISLFIKKN
jgi:hypothetical protein